MQFQQDTGETQPVKGTRQNRDAPGKVEKLLVIRLSSIGDIVHALPAVSALAAAHPQARIDWVVEDRYASLLEDNPHLRRVIRLDTIGWRHHRVRSQTLREIGAGLRELRAERYDAVVDFQGLIKTGVLARLCRAERRIGYARFRHREPGAGLFYTTEIAPPENAHAVEENLALARSLGAQAGEWRFPLPRRGEDERYAEEQLAAAGIGEFIIVNPGGGWVAKRWSPDHYARLIERLSSAAEGLPRIVLTGSKAEEASAQEIIQHSNCGQARFIPTSLTQYVSLARRARLFVGGDTGPMHVAAALGIPVVAILGPTDPRRNGPFARDDIALSNNDVVNHSRRSRRQTFLEGVSVQAVFEAVKTRLGRSDAR